MSNTEQKLNCLIEQIEDEFINQNK